MEFDDADALKLKLTTTADGDMVEAWKSHRSCRVLD